MTTLEHRMKPERLQVTIGEAAEMLGYCVSTIYNLLSRNELRSVGRGKMRRIPIAELKAWQQRNTE